MLTKVLSPGGERGLGGLRYSLAIAWMTAVGAEMLMAENGMGNLLVGAACGLRGCRRVSDPAVILVGIMALARWLGDGRPGPDRDRAAHPLARDAGHPGEAGGSSLSWPSRPSMGLRPRSGASACRPGLWARITSRTSSCFPPCASLAEEALFLIESEILPTASR